MSTADAVRVALERPDQPEVRALIAALDAYQKPLYPPQSHHGIDEAALRDPNVLFAVARDSDETLVACGAVLLTPAYAELKRMFTSPQRRGVGIGTAMLRFIEDEARARGVQRQTVTTLPAKDIQSDQAHRPLLCGPVSGARMPGRAP